MNRVKLADIIDAIETASDAWAYFLDKRTNEVRFYDNYNKELNDFEPVLLLTGVAWALSSAVEAADAGM